LEEGRNIVGRKGTTSKATVQIATEDRYMSRQHCSITVTTLPDGTKKAVLSNYQNKNLTTVDGQEIETGDEIRLTNGDRITMGHTTVVFKL
jgi:pSer/pThr/pTyr-binding forkhead associated (FHA) protein